MNQDTHNEDAAMDFEIEEFDNVDGMNVPMTVRC